MKLGTFRQHEAERIKNRREQLFSTAACQSFSDDIHLGKGFENENLYQDIRSDALQFFKARNIAWHGNGTCDSSLLSSQVAAVNFLFPLLSRPEELAAVFGESFADVMEALPITADKQEAEAVTPFLTFEWIGLKNYLKEPGVRQRGKYVTNVDIVMRFRQKDGKVHLVLVEWKYTESYTEATPNRFSERGTDRLKIYEPFLRLPECPVHVEVPVEELFVDPFYQLMRLQLLAKEMEREREMDADTTSVLVIAPKANKELNTGATCKPLAKCGGTIQDAWRGIVAENKFHSIYTEDLLERIKATCSDRDWVNYLACRYGDMR